MIDREMLEFAAKAAGLKEFGWMADTLTHVVNNQFVFWEPLTDDGDAFRLAVKLQLELCTPTQWFNNNEDHLYCSASVGDGLNTHEHVDIKLSEGGDPCAAMRLVIVKAAAAIGKSME